MEDDLQIIETFESDEWKNFVRRKVFHRTRWDICVFFEISTHNGFPSLIFQAKMKFRDVIYTMESGHDLLAVERMGCKIITDWIIESFVKHILDFERDKERVSAIEIKNTFDYDLQRWGYEV